MPTEIELKQAHAAQICQQIDDIKAAIDNSDPDPWYGGLPPLYMQLSNTLGFHSSAIKEKFGLVSNPQA